MEKLAPAVGEQLSIGYFALLAHEVLYGIRKLESTD
jgi:hypothetical protein